MDFPEFIFFTVTNACNLRCRMCGQWSEEGYILNRSRFNIEPCRDDSPYFYELRRGISPDYAWLLGGSESRGVWNSVRPDEEKKQEE